jgi:hypothetical protein
MLTSRGFTNVVDTGWDLRVTLSLRRRIESGELLGYLYSWVSVVPAEGDSLLLEELRACLHYLADAAARDAAEAAAIEERNIARGADLLKLLTGSYVERGKVLPMPEATAEAAVNVAHRHGQLAYSHASNLAGTLVANSERSRCARTCARQSRRHRLEIAPQDGRAARGHGPHLEDVCDYRNYKSGLSSAHLCRDPKIPFARRPIVIRNRCWLHDRLP